MQRSFDPESAFLHVMQQDVLALALIAMAMAVVTGLLFGEYILRPLQLLVRGAREMEKGNYDYPLGGKRNDELGYVVSRFAFMRQRERAYLGSLEQVGRLKSQFLSVAAHELRTPISVLVAYRDVLADGQLGPVTEQQREALETMRENLTRMTRLADDAARFAGVKSERLAYEFQPENVESIVRHAVTTAQAAGAGRSVNIEAACDPIRDEVEADAESLEHAIVQLITNGIRFTPDGGHVVAHAREVDGRLHIEVKDSGVGLSAEKLETLLAHGATAIEINHYRSATGLEFNSPGMGLGLSVARAIVEAHGGILRAESRPGEGSTFVLELPMKRPLDLASAA
jgi:signal transduction histidine kinase